MVSEAMFVQMALAFPGTETTVHFERTGFKVQGKRMFATYLQQNHSANIFLTKADQDVFCQMDSRHIYPVPNKWGEKGATTFELAHLSKEVVQEALHSAYKEVMQRKK